MVQQQIDPIEEMSFIAADLGSRILFGEGRFKPVIVIAHADGANAARGRRHKQPTQMRIDYGVSYLHILRTLLLSPFNRAIDDWARKRDRLNRIDSGILLILSI
jgi:hypothetical protein